MSIHNDFSIHHHHNNSTTTRDIQTTNKRKRDDFRDDYDPIDIDKRPFAVRADSTNPFAPPRLFTPQCLLPRSQLPLACLDTAHDGGRLFVANVHVLEACHEYGGDNNVLIVESMSENEKRLYAVERVRRHKYALCRLARYVNAEELILKATVELRPPDSVSKRQALEPPRGRGQEWWKVAAVDMQHVATPQSSTIPRLSMRSQVTAPEILQQVEVAEHLPQDIAPAQPVSQDETLQELTRQYLDALYLSRTPLAYFVKGPLARARAAFLSQPAELITFLRGAILTSVVMDKKFREVLAEIIKDNAALDAPGTVSSKQKRKRKWRPKRDKQGFFVDEKDHVEQWWQKLEGNAKDLAANETFDDVLRRRSQVIRNRESLLQVIMIMEILALEATAPLASAAADTTSALAVGSHSQDPNPADAEKKPRKKKDVNVTAILETLVERLNIFHTLESSPVKTRDGDNGSAKPDSKDELKSFATEVIIPFFASRIYEVTNSTSKKLGGPSAPRPIDKKSTAALTLRKPGEPTTRQPPEKKPRKPLGRTSTDTLSKIGRQPPALYRSITDLDALAPLIKRENSEAPSLPLQNISAAEGVPRKRTTVLDQYAARHKQIDLSAMSQNFEQKKAKNKNIEDKILRDALNGIRKPNRALATEETAKNADESFARALARSKTAKSQTNRSNASVKESRTVSATPRHIKATPAPRRCAAQRSQDSGGHGSGCTAVVPSSSDRLPVEPDVVPGSTPAIPQTGHRQRQQKHVLETPSRGFAKFMPVGLASQPGTLLIESPTLNRSAPQEAVSATPMRSLRMPSLAETPMSKLNIATTTLAQSLPAGVASIQRDDSGVALSSSFSAMAGNEKVNSVQVEVSIYDALGWNDDDYDLA